MRMPIPETAQHQLKTPLAVVQEKQQSPRKEYSKVLVPKVDKQKC